MSPDVRAALLRQPLAAVPRVIVDVETTGLDPRRGDRVIELAALRVEPDGREQLYSQLIDPGRPIDPAASRVNGIYDRDVAGAPTFAQVAESLLGAMNDAVFVAHNAGFDLGFLKHEMGLAGLALPEPPIVDTLWLARRCFSFRSNALGSVAKQLGVRVTDAHRAGGDVQTTRGVLDAMRAKLDPESAWRVEEWIVAQQLGTRSERAQAVSPAVPPRADLRLPEPLATAVRERLPVAIRYRSRGRRASERVVEPIAQEGFYLVAFCRLKHAERTFRLDRIEGAWWPSDSS